MSNDHLNKLRSLPRSTNFSTWRLPLDSSVGTTLCLPSDLKQPFPPEWWPPHSLSWVLLDAPSLWPRRLLFPLQSSFIVCQWLLPEYPRQVPQPTLPFYLHQSTYGLPSTMTGCHTNTTIAPLSACHKAQVKMLPILADLSWSPLPHVSLCTAVVFQSFFFSSHYILLPVYLFCLNCHLPLLGPETHSLRACQSLCPSSNCVLSNRTWHSSSFPPDTPAAFFKAAFSSSATRQSWWTQHEAYSSLTAHLILLCRHHAFQRIDFPLLPFLFIFSSALAFACLLWFEKISI